MEAHWATLWERVADAVPDRPAVVQGPRRLTWAELDERSARFAGVLGSFGVRRGARVALYLFNCPEYVESHRGALKARCVPVNVNYRYRAEELAYLLADAGAEVLVYHASLRDRVDKALPSAGALKLLLEVDDLPGGRDGPSGSLPYEAALRSVAPAPRVRRSAEDLTMLYTGGTTGMPKGVVSKVGPHVNAIVASVAPMVGGPAALSLADVPRLAAEVTESKRAIVSLVACPLMHGTGMGLGLVPALALGGSVVLLQGRRFDPAEAWATVGREQVSWMTIVGDPFARPLLQTLRADRGGEVGSSLRVVGSSGAMFSAEVRAGLLERLPRLLVLDYIASSEGTMGVAVSRAGQVMATGHFTPAAGVEVFGDDDRPVVPGSGRAGRVGLSRGVPEGYFNDRAKSAATFREVGGVRYSFPGDWATVEDDGTIGLLGRGSQCINTGGEKVFAEEVEEAIKTHRAVEDCLVFSLPHQRLGEQVAAVLSVEGGAPVDLDEVLSFVATRLAHFKVPRVASVVDEVPRMPSGKADYEKARALLSQSVTTSSS